MSAIDDLMKTLGLSYEELKPSERETYHSWLNTMSGRVVTIPDVQGFIRQLIEDNIKKTTPDVLKDPVKASWMYAELNCYLILEAFLSSPEKAKERLEKYLMAKKAALGKTTRVA